MNYLQLTQRLHRESLRSGAAPGAIAGATKESLRMFGWIADAWVEVQNFTRWDWQRTRLSASLTPGVASYTGAALGAANVRAWWPPGPEYAPIVAPAGDPGRISELVWVPYDTFRRQHLVGVTQAGAPQYWAEGPGGALLLSPTPDQAYTLDIDYRAENTELAAEADTPLMPDRHHLVLVWRALQEQAAADAAPEMFARAKANYLTAFSSLVDDEDQKMTIVRRRIA